MKIVIFGLTTGFPEDTAHGTRWRALAVALAGRGHRVVALDRAAGLETVESESVRHPYLDHPNLERLIYTDWPQIAADASRHANDAALAMVIAEGRDALAAADLVLNSRAARKVVYDPDTPSTLASWIAGEPSGSLPPQGLAGFDLLLGSVGGPLLESLRIRTDAAQAAPLYPWIVPSLHRPSEAKKDFLGDLCCLVPDCAATQEGLENLFLEPARRLPRRRFVIAGSSLPVTTRPANIVSIADLPLTERPAFFASSTLTLSLVRDDCRKAGWCPPPRLLEAAACGVPIVSDRWEGLETFFDPGREILVAAQSDDVTTALMLPRNHLTDLGRRARQRILAEHTAERRVLELRTLFDLRGGGGDD